ncbi:MAG TPA: DUF72 domain-containing protein [Nocardioides sp.]|uniref:DUF72 domain-containing protein n=1 Tax=Nocardioides sp. TaxID=35761 RepID=UPI002C526BC5|nr:DUF72 domain-containing protein [Nocardioides sp.]HTW17859.1 DUF72 domain-containing protein [Nocardioides sp.]
MGVIRVGISGWSYARWRGDYYPRGLKKREELAYAAGRLGSIEINGSFYSLQRPTSYARWAAETPDGFVFAVKGGRYVTHMKRLRDVEAPLANFFASGVLALGAKLGPILWQLPERLEYDAGLLAAFFEQLPRTTQEVADLARRHDDKLADDRTVTSTDLDLPVRHALEFRSPTYCTDEAFALLREHDVACVVADTAGRFPMAEAVTSDLIYVRLHGDTELYASGYDDAALRRWAERCRSWAEGGDVDEVVVYFDNDARGHAPHDAERLQELLGTDHAPFATATAR